MYTAQRVIKWFATALAVLIIFGMTAALLGVGALVTGILGGWDEGDLSSEETSVMEAELPETVISGQEFESLTVDTKLANVRIESGDKFEVVANEDLVEVRRAEGGIYIEERERGWRGWYHHAQNALYDLKIVVPEVELTKLDLNTGAGTLNLSGLTAQEMNLSLGAGRTEVSDLKVKRKAKIDSGAGYLIVRESSLRDLDLDMGAGKVEIGAELLGQAKIDAGMGKLEVNLKETKDNYRIGVSKGIGAVTVNGLEIGDGGSYGDGENLVKVSGGVGAIEIKL